VKKLFTWIASFLFAATILVPLLWVLMSSVKPGYKIISSPWALPSLKDLHWENYAHAWGEAGIGHYFVNSLIVTVASLAILLPIGAMAAYVFARYPFKGSHFLFGTFLGGMMFPNFLIVVPLFMLLTQLGLYDTKEGLVLVYVAYSLSFTIFVMSGFFSAMPGELAEAAMIDGCGHAGTFWKIMLPLARPGLMVVGIFNAIGLWNEYGLALVLINSPQNKTLPLGLANLVMTEHYQSDWGALFAALVIVMLPVMAAYLVFRDRIYETMLAGAIKG
jgi:N-acetylglucosamine transport system permease protein